MSWDKGNLKHHDFMNLTLIFLHSSSLEYHFHIFRTLQYKSKTAQPWSGVSIINWSYNQIKFKVKTCYCSLQSVFCGYLLFKACLNTSDFRVSYFELNGNMHCFQTSASMCVVWIRPVGYKRKLKYDWQYRRERKHFFHIKRSYSFSCSLILRYWILFFFAQMKTVLEV